jgi:predicted RNA binding protein YcfA (HicA-like mRNA interferase family)
LERAGWTLDRIRGSHFVLKSADGLRVIVPVHGNKTLPIGTLEGIIEQSRIPVAEFEALLRGKKP